MSFDANSVNINEQSATCTFVVDNFSNRTTTKEKPFSLPPDKKTSFILCMNPDIGTSTTYWYSKYASFCIYLSQSPNQGRITVGYRMSIVNAKEQKFNIQEGKIKFSQLYQFRGQYILSRDDLMNTANGWLVNNSLTVCCEVYVIDSDLDEIADQLIKSPSSMPQDYGSLFESGKLSDLVLVAGGTEFKVHKAILGARSAVFSAMFAHDTKEKQENRIEVENVTGETYRELLRYIYTDQVDKMEENALELMVAADKYQMDHLKAICVQYLGSNLSTESVAITLIMADLHRADDLKAKCFEYIGNNARDVKNTEGWKTLTANADLITEVVLYVTDKQNK